jgi:uncharacterized protein YbjT (DUF2867 family)
MTRIAVVGATGQLGHHLVSRALEQGHSVTALVRDPRAMKRQDERLTVIQGDAETGDGLDAAFSGAHYVVYAVGSLRPIMERCMIHLLLALDTRKSLHRFVLISRLGSGESLEQSSRVSGPLQSRLPRLLAPIFKDINLAEARVRASKVPYTILRATRLSDDLTPTSVEVVDATQPPPHRVGRRALAHFVIDHLESPELLRKELTVGAV